MVDSVAKGWCFIVVMQVIVSMWKFLPFISVFQCAVELGWCCLSVTVTRKEEVAQSGILRS